MLFSIWIETQFIKVKAYWLGNSGSRIPRLERPSSRNMTKSQLLSSSAWESCKRWTQASIFSQIKGFIWQAMIKPPMMVYASLVSSFLSRLPAGPNRRLHCFVPGRGRLCPLCQPGFPGPSLAFVRVSQRPASRDARRWGASDDSLPHAGQEAFGNMKDTPHSSIWGLLAMLITQPGWWEWESNLLMDSCPLLQPGAVQWVSN